MMLLLSCFCGVLSRLCSYLVFGKNLLFIQRKDSFSIYFGSEQSFPKAATFLNHDKNKEYKRYFWKTTARDIAGA